MMMMKTTIRKLLQSLLLLDLVMGLFSLWMGGLWLLNTQVAFACSLVITVATFISYHKLVERRVEAGAYDEQKDLLKKYEDPHDLYDECEDEHHELSENMTPLKIGFKESFRNLTQSYKGALSPYRLGAYGLLFLSLLFLIRHDTLEPIAFFVGLSVVPIGSLLFGNRGSR